jgi:hypothetical protein
MDLDYRSLLDASSWTARRVGKPLKEILTRGAFINEFTSIFEVYLYFVRKEETTVKEAEQIWTTLIDVCILLLIAFLAINKNRYTFVLSKMSLPMHVKPDSIMRMPNFFKSIRSHLQPSTRLALTISSKYSETFTRLVHSKRRFSR